MQDSQGDNNHNPLYNYKGQTIFWGGLQANIKYKLMIINADKIGEHVTTNSRYKTEYYQLFVNPLENYLSPTLLQNVPFILSIPCKAFTIALNTYPLNLDDIHKHKNQFFNLVIHITKKSTQKIVIDYVQFVTPETVNINGVIPKDLEKTP